MKSPYSKHELNSREVKWNNYQNASQGRSAQERLLNFLNEHRSEIHTATELGCGAGMDAAYLASMGIKTYAFDGFMSKAARKELSKLPKEVKQNLTIGKNQLFENLSLPGPADLVYSYAALPFCKPEYFPNLISTIAQNVNPNGYFVSQFFRDDHRFTKVENTDATGFTVKQLTDTFEYLGFQVKAEEFKWEKTQNGVHSDDLHNIMIYAKAPEHLPDYTLERIGELLGLQPEQTNTNNQEESTNQYSQQDVSLQKEETAPTEQSYLENQNSADNNFSAETTTQTDSFVSTENATQTYSSNPTVNNIVSEILSTRSEIASQTPQPTAEASAITATSTTTMSTMDMGMGVEA